MRLGLIMSVEESVLYITCQGVTEASEAHYRRWMNMRRTDALELALPLARDEGGRPGTDGRLKAVAG